MDKVFKPYCPCKQLNEDQSKVCVVCGKPYDIDDEYNGQDNTLCSCPQPVQKSLNDNCVICRKSLKDYIATSMGDAARAYCLCVALTGRDQNNKCEVCEKPKIFDKKIIFCFCPEPTATNQEKQCVVCGKQKYFKMENVDDRCWCQGTTKTNKEEKCVVCGKRKRFNDMVKYCYKKKSCPYSNPNRLISCVTNRIHCPLRNINSCPWNGTIDEVEQHCSDNHQRNFFTKDAAIHCSAHLREYGELDYFTTDFVIATYDRLFKCSFEINPRGLMKWVVVVLKKKDENEWAESNETYKFFIEFMNPNRDHMYLEAYCIKESVSIFGDFVTSVKIHKDHLQPFQDAQNHILYRLFIVHIPHTPMGVLANFYDSSRGYFMLEWSDCKLPEPTVYEDICNCVKTFPENCLP